MRVLMWACAFRLLGWLAALVGVLAWPLLLVIKALKYVGDKAELEYLLADLERKIKNRRRL